jgi:cation diffusion facilitator family transporter
VARDGQNRSVSSSILPRYARLSIAAALATIALKTFAWWLTGSVGLLSDAMESLVNLAAAIVTLVMLGLAARPPDEEHAYGYSKAEYFASGFEGTLIFVAAAAIAVAAIDRLVAPRPITSVGIGLAISTVAAAVNLGVGVVLMRAGRRHRSIALEADARHLMTDVWTTAGVIVAVMLVAVTGWQPLDPLVALAVAANILWSGMGLIRRSFLGLLDRAVPPDERRAIETILDAYGREGVQYHALRTREAAGRSFVSVHILVPGDWSVQRGHDVLERIEADIRSRLPTASVLTHLEPREDPVSFQDVTLDRPGDERRS